MKTSSQILAVGMILATANASFLPAARSTHKGELGTVSKPSRRCSLCGVKNPDNIDSLVPIRTIPKHVGIVAVSTEGAALCYRTMCSEAEQYLGEHRHPEVTMHTLCGAEYLEHIRKGDWQGAGLLMAESSKKLAQIGVDLCICPCNTIHQAYSVAVAESNGMEWLHIAEAVAQEASRRGFRKVGITGTDSLVTGPVYLEMMGLAGIECVIPTLKQRKRTDRIIFDRLTKSKFYNEDRVFFQDVFRSLADAGCDAVVMGCTEIPLLMDGVDTPVPVLDSTRLLARAALKKSLMMDSD